MLNTYCTGCGAVNNIGRDFCAGCGANLTVQPQFASATNAGATQHHEWQPFRDPHRALAGIKPFGPIEVIGKTVRLYTRHLWLITKIVFVVVTPFEILKVMRLAEGMDWQTRGTTLLLGAICNVLIAPALIYALMKVLETGAAPGINESFRWGLTKLWRLAICAAISWVLQALGYMLCVVPGIIVSLTLAVVYPVAVLENGSPEKVLRRSSQLTRGYRFEILLAWFLLGLGGALIIGLPAALLADVNSAPLSAAAAIVVDIAEQAFTVMSLVMYLSLLRTPRQGHLLLPLPY